MYKKARGYHRISRFVQFLFQCDIQTLDAFCTERFLDFILVTFPPLSDLHVVIFTLHSPFSSVPMYETLVMVSLLFFRHENAEGSWKNMDGATSGLEISFSM